MRFLLDWINNATGSRRFLGAFQPAFDLRGHLSRKALPAAFRCLRVSNSLGNRICFMSLFCAYLQRTYFEYRTLPIRLPSSFEIRSACVPKVATPPALSVSET